MNQQPPQTPAQGFALPEPVPQGGTLPPPPPTPPALPGYMPTQQTYVPIAPQYSAAQPAPYYQQQPPVEQQLFQSPVYQNPVVPSVQPAPAPALQEAQPVISMPPAPIQAPYVPEAVQSQEKQIEKEQNDAIVTTENNENAEQIDQEWVHKTKEVIDKTHSDPYQESLQLSRVKADYLKARYNKTIKVQKT